MQLKQRRKKSQPVSWSLWKIHDDKKHVASGPDFYLVIQMHLFIYFFV